MVCIISCFYIIKSKFSVEKYFSWISNFLKLNFNCVIFTDRRSIPFLTSRFQKQLSRDNIKIILLEFNQFYTSKYDWSHDLSIDHEIRKGVNHSIELYKIWNEKIFFLNRVIEKNPFSDQHFLWLDIGSFRNPGKMAEIAGFGFPQPHNFIKGKVSMFLTEKFVDSDFMNPEKIDHRFRNVNRLGGMFGGDAESLIEFRQKFENLLAEFKEKRIFAGKDQSIYNFLYIQNPDLIDVIDAKSVKEGYDKWFCFHYYFSNYYKPRVSVLVPIYNGIEFIDGCIRSIMSQSFKEWEIVIGVNGFDRRSEVFGIADKYSRYNIKVLDLGKGIGRNKKSWALNKMLPWCKGEWIALLDVDDLWEQNKLKKQMEKCGDYDILGTKCKYFGDSNAIPQIPVGDLKNYNFLSSNPIINSSCLVRKTVFDKIVWAVDCILEDYDFWLKCWKAGFRFYNLGEVLVAHRIHKASAFNGNNNQYVAELRNLYR